MNTKQYFRYRIVQRSGLLAAIVFVSLLFTGNVVKADINKTVYASELAGSVWEAEYNDNANITLILDKDCKIQGIRQSFSDWENEGKFRIIGNGHKMKVGSAGINLDASSLKIENAIIEIDTTQKYNGSYQYGIFTNTGYPIEFSRCNLDIKTSSRAIGDNYPVLSECAVESGSPGGENVSIRATNFIESARITVTEPKEGETANLMCSVDDENIIVSRMLNNDKGITWSEGEKVYGLGEDCVFQTGHTYRCTAGIQAKLGKVTSATKVKINGHDAVFAEEKSGHSWFYYDFVIPVPQKPSENDNPDSAAKNDIKPVTVGVGTYTVQNGEAAFTGPVKKTARTVTVPAAIKVGDQTVKVTAIAPNAFKSMKKLTTVTIGKNIKSIGAKAFYKCKALRNIKIKTKKLTKKTIGSKAFTGINKKAVIKSPKAKKKVYKKILLKKGMKKSMTFK